MRNPFITDRPLGAEDLFVGRRRELAALQDMWLDRSRVLVLFGATRSGKTSLLNQFAAQASSSTRVISVDYARLPAPPDPLAVKLARAALQALAWEGTYSQDALADLAQCASQLAEGDVRQICVALDGLDVSDCAAGQDFTEAIDRLKEACGQTSLALVLAVEARPAECAPVPAGVPSLVLSGLSLEETEDLLLVPARGTLTLDAESMRRIFALTGGEPYLVQLYGEVLYEQRAQRGWAGLIETEHALEEVVQRAGPHLGEVWKRCSVPARIMLSVYAESMGAHGYGTAEDIHRRLERLNVAMPMADVQRGLSELEQRYLVERLGGGLYRFRSALFLRWLRENRTLAEALQQARNYRRAPRPPVPPLLNRRIDWLGLSLWVLIAALVGAVGYVWRSREMRVTWTDTPPAPTATIGLPAQGGSSAGTQGSAGQLAFMAKATAGQNWDIYLINTDGTNRTRLTQDEGDNTGPVWSPDGERLAFVSDRDGNREVYVMNADGSEPVNLTKHDAEDWTPTWSPDGRRLAFASFRDGNWEIYVMNADGSNQQRLTDSPGADYSPAWSPRGDAIAFVSDRTGNLEIHLMAPDGSEVRAVTSDPATDQAPAWSHDGTQLLWESYRDGNMEIMAMNVADQEPRNLTQDHYADDHGGTFAPDGEAIAYFSNRDGGWDIYLLSLANSERANVTRSGEMEQYPAFRPQ
ncbi:MAG: hypothetical protein ACOX2L_10470 [Anaerolineae bacterium]|nr:hypothetical protein [Chloroflexota bacterium]